MKKYFEDINSNLSEMYAIAIAARKCGYEPLNEVEIPLAKNMAERVVGIISIVAPQIRNSRIIERIEELEKQYGAQDWRVALKIAEETAKEIFCKFSSKKEAIEVGIRVGIAYITVGVVASPIEGFVELKFRKRKDGKDYIALFYSGPIRSAGGTAGAVSVLIADYVRCAMGLDGYDINESELKRSITEVYDYHEKVTNLQYLPSEEELRFLLERLPLQIDGDPSEDYEVSNFKDLARIETNRIRNGVCLILGECLSAKAPKLLKQLNLWGKDFGLDHWSFLDDFVKLQKKLRSAGVVKDESIKISPDYNFIKDIVAGRPVLTYPMTIGGFRLRYGRTRTSGFSSNAIHPATMAILEDYIAIGTQLKTERPGKSTVVSVCDLIEGPIVKLKNGDVVFAENKEIANAIKNDVEEILFLGDMLINYGDFFNRAHKLIPCGYNEEWYAAELERVKAEDEYIKDIITNPYKKVNVNDAVRVAIQFDVPMHPRYTYHWKDINHEQFMSLINWYKIASISKEKIVVPLSNDIYVDGDMDPKRVLELLGIPHKVVAKEHIVLEGEDANALAFYFRHLDIFEFDDEKDVLKIINKLAGIKIRDKSGTYIGARMGRPEKAKMRKLTGSPQVLFPVGKEGGKMRNLQESLKKGKVSAEFPLMFCEKCNKETIYFVCEGCGEKTKKRYYCYHCKKIYEEPCSMHESVNSMPKDIDINYYYKKALELAGLEAYVEMIKGVKGTSNEGSVPEHLVKGILRSRNKLYVNKDGTIRYDMTEMAITHFKPKEIGTSIGILKKLGYLKDIYGKELGDEEQIVELRCQDIILPACVESLEEGADEVLFRVSKFIDDLLINLYKMKPFYNLKNKAALVGHYVVAMSPHTSAGIVGRIIGFSKTQGFFAHPLLHSIMRRDCLFYDTYIPLFDGSKWSIDKIGELVEKLNPIKTVDAFGTKAVKIKNYGTVGHKENKLLVVPIADFTKHKKSEGLLIKTECGREIKVTKNHKFVLKNGLKKEAVDLKIGEKIIIPYRLDIEEKDIDNLDLLDLFSYMDSLMIRNTRGFINILIERLGGKAKTIKLLNIRRKNLDNYLLRDSFPYKIVLKLLMLNKCSLKDLPGSIRVGSANDHITFPRRVKLDKDLLYLIGLYLAEGYCRRNKRLNQIDISASEGEIRSNVKHMMKKLFDITPTYITQERLVYSSRLLYELVDNVFRCGRNAHEKRVPALFLNLPKKKIAYLLQGYFDGDGSVSLSDCRVTCDSVSKGFLQDLEFILKRFGIFVKYYNYSKQPGPKVRDFYIKKNKIIPKFKITKLIITSSFYETFYKKIGFCLKRKQKILKKLVETCKPYGMKMEFDKNNIYSKIVSINILPKEISYCLNVENHKIIPNGFLTGQCDGDEACVILLMDALLNFSRKYLPNRRGVTQDAPLVLTSTLIPKEVDNMIFDMDIAWKYPLELYESAMEYKNPWEVKIEKFGDNLGGEKEYIGLGFTHDTSNINSGIRCSAYKSIPNMMDKVRGQMSLAEKLRCVDENDVAKLLIERHFMRDIKGNLRKFSQQQFRCVECNEKYRRPPLAGKCLKCNGRLLFTVAEGSIVKYVEPSFDLAARYTLPPYLNQVLQITRKRIESIFGRDPEKQEGLNKWFQSK